MKNILIIAGGSCAGKSTLISQVLIPLLTTKGIEYSFIPEVATTLLLKGKEYKSTYDFQYEILDCQLYEEAQIFKELKGMQLIVLERSALDGVALLSKEEGDQLLNAFMINSRQELASRYHERNEQDLW